MKISKLKERLRHDRPMVTISLRMPEDVIEDLKQIAPRLGFTGYQPLIRAYVGQGLRVDLERLRESFELERFLESLRQRGVAEETISEAMADLKKAA